MVNFEATVSLPVALVSLMISLIGFPIIAIYRGWLVPRPFHQAEINRRLEEKAAKDNALAANKDLIEANNLLLRRDDLSITTLQEIRDYIHRHDPPPTTGGGSP
jgi:hypothetical protein